MYYNESCARLHEQKMQQLGQAAKGHTRGAGGRHLNIRSRQRAAVNVYKTENSYELLVFAPGRIRENFSLAVNGNELTVSYTPPENFPKFEWVLREYSRGGFVRTFNLDDNINKTAITAKYTDGVLQVSLPLVAVEKSSRQEIPVS